MVGTAHPTLLPVAPDEQASCAAGNCSPGAPAPAEAISLALRSGLLLAYGLSGAAAMVYEVAWTRGLALVIGSSVYAFSLMLAAFILGLAIGSAIIARHIDRMRNQVYWFAVLELGIGLSAMVALPLIGLLPVLMVRVVLWLAGSFVTLQTAEFVLVLLIMMVPTTLMGAAFPLVCRLCAARSGRLGRSVGSVYAANTVGAIVGTFACSFILIPRLGTQNAVLAAVACNIAIGVAFVLAAPGAGWARRAAAALAVVPFAAWAFHGVQPWDPSIIASGAYIYAERLAPVEADAGSIRDRMQRVPVVYHKEDMCTAVTVRKYPNGVRTLAVGGKVDASSRGDLSTQLLLAHAPLLLHPDPHNALVIGLASGMTLSSAACYDLDRLDCAEISPAVVEASHFFDPENGNVLSDPRVRLIIGDGRNHLALTDTAYDVIISEPSNPWIAGVADLFTKQFFEVCRQRLAPGGLACVWLHAYQMEEPLFRSVVRTFHETFPHMVLVESLPMSDYLLIGSAQPLRTPYSALTSRFFLPKVAAELRRINIRQPVDFLKRVVMAADVDKYAAGAVLHTDDNALLEFAAPRGLYRRRLEVQTALGLNTYRKADISFLQVDPLQLDRLGSLRSELEPLARAQVLGNQAVDLYNRERYEEAFAAAAEAARLDPAGPEVLNAQGRNILAWAMDLGPQAADPEQARQRAAAMAPNLAGMFQRLVETFTGTRRWAEAADVLEDAAFFQPTNLTVIDQLSWLQATCPLDGVRNGAQAAQNAAYCCQATGNRNPAYLKTLAAAYAENGAFEDAVRAAGSAAGLARQSGQAALAAEIDTQLACYRQGKPYRLADK